MRKGAVVAVLAIVVGVSSLQFSLVKELKNDPDAVRVDLFVMSKCPDANVCETTMSPVIQQVGSIVDLHVNYIAQQDSSQASGFTCMHGQTECWGDIQQLCAYSHYSQNYTWWNFVLCQDQSQGTIPNNGQSCSQTAGMDWNTINNCTTGAEGSNLMSASIKYTDSQNIKVSCTMYVENQLYCIHDGDWKQCKDHTTQGIVAYICQQYQGANPPPACKSIITNVH